MGQTILIWKQKPEDLEDSAYQEKKSNVKNLTVEEWPGYRPQKKSAKSKKLKNADDWKKFPKASKSDHCAKLPTAIWFLVMLPYVLKSVSSREIHLVE